MKEFVPWREKNRTYLKDVVPLDTPYLLAIEVSSLCNAHCKYCIHSQSKVEGFYQGNMSFTLFKRIIDEAKVFSHKIKKVDLNSVGESLCNPEFPDMVRYVKEKEITKEVQFITNGILLTPDKIDKIIDAGINTIRISLQGLDAEMYKDVCGVDLDFEKFLFNLTYLYKHKKNCNIRMKIIDLAIKDIPNGRKKLEDMFGDICDSLYVENVIPMFSNVDYSQIASNNSRRYDIQNKIEHKVCSAAFYKMIVCSDGKVTNCCDPLHRIEWGNVMEDNLVDIWNSSEHYQFQKSLLEGKILSFDACRKCPVPNDILSDEDNLDEYTHLVLPRYVHIK